MTEPHSSDSLDNKEKFNDLFSLAVWSGVLFLCALTLRNYYLAGQPPIWDSLAYQQKSLRFLTHWLDGSLGKSFKDIYGEMYPAYVLSLATSFLLFGFNSFSPYLVSAFFGAGCMIAVYLLSRELGAGRHMAFWGVVALSLLPNFIYQNFLETRNDFSLAFFITVSWVLFLRGIKSKNLKLGFLAGILAGVGTLFKASAPGYVVWGVVAFLVLPEKYNFVEIQNRIKLALLFVFGAVLACGWHYLPHLEQTLNYYSSWGEAARSWKETQYNLQSDWTVYFFYLKNIINLHLGNTVALGVAFFSGVLLIRWLAIDRSKKFTKEFLMEFSLIALIFIAATTPLIFISWRESFSSLGDVPVLPLLAAGTIAFLSKISTGFVIPRVFLGALLPVGLIVSFSTLQNISKPFLAQDFTKFSHETMKIRKEFALGKSPMMQVYSHPIYNVDTLSWSWHMNPGTERNMVHSPTRNFQIMFPEDGRTIASKLKRFPLLILSEYPGTVIQGEKFNTLNRLHSKINLALYEQGQFLKLRSLNLEEGRFPVHFMLNKNFSVLRSTQTTTDNWTEWEGEVEYFASKQAKLIWRGVPIRKMESFLLVEKGSPASTIKMTHHRVLPNGKHEYQSKMVPATDKLLTYIIMPESPDLLLPASKMERRMLAFNQVETEVIKYD